jgi:hypothetical protein
MTGLFSQISGATLQRYSTMPGLALESHLAESTELHASPFTIY